MSKKEKAEVGEEGQEGLLQSLYVGLVNPEFSAGQIEDFSLQELHQLINELDDSDEIKTIVKARFLSEAKLKNQDIDSPFIEWLPMNRQPENWLALALAKVIKAELNIAPSDVLLMIPSSGLWLEEEFRKVFSENDFPELKKEEQLSKDDQIFASFQVKSHSNGQALKTMYFRTDPVKFSNRRIVIIDDVMARGDACEGVIAFLNSLGINITSYSAAVVMDKTMQGGLEKLVLGPDAPIDSYRSLVSVSNVELGNNNKGKFTLD